LLDAALSVSDIEGLSLRKLALGLGVTPAAAYRHFEDREDLLTEVARVGFDQLGDQFALAFDLAHPPVNRQDAHLRLVRLARAYVQFADDQPALWRLMFGAQAQAYRNSSISQRRRSSYDYLPAALLGLYLTGAVKIQPTERDTLFAWSAVHGAAALRLGRVPTACVSVDQLAREVAERVIASLNAPGVQ
jgi:AcrR family transcriptional regulator